MVVKKNNVREQRIIYEIVVDAYGSEEQALGWYYYIENALEFPFHAICISTRANSPLRKEEVVKVIGMPAEKDCTQEVLVTIEFCDHTMSVPLCQLKPLSVAPNARKAIDDWQYWVARGYQF
ncbi:MAG TPA: calcium-binding protein [Candidatus Paceibacterota bacterium]